MAERAAAIAKKPEVKQKCPSTCKQKPGLNSSGCPAEILLNLQRTAGNQAVQKLIKSGALQNKYKIGKTDDKYKEKAGEVSGKKVSMSEPSLKKWPQEEQCKEEKPQAIKEQPAKSKPEVRIETKKQVTEAPKTKPVPKAKPTSTAKPVPRAKSVPKITSVPKAKPVSRTIQVLKAIQVPKPAPVSETTPTLEASHEPTILPEAPRKTLPSAEVPRNVPEVAVPEIAHKGKEETAVEAAVGGKVPKEEKAPKKAVDQGKEAGKKVPSSPKEDPDFQAVTQRSKKTADKEKTHAPAAVKSAEAQAAAVSPPNEVPSIAEAGQVQEMDQAKPKRFDKASFKAALLQKIESMAPKNLKETDEFKESGKVESVKGDLTNEVAQSKEESQGEIKGKVEEPPDSSGIGPKPVTPLPPADAGPNPEDINAAQAAPKPRPESDISLQAESAKLDKKMADANVTEKTLQNSNEPSFVAAANAKKNAQTGATKAPQNYRKDEQSTLSQTQAEMAQTAQSQIGGMHASRQEQTTQVSMKQGTSKGKDEKKREEIANHIQAIYDGTKQRVEAGLKKLDDDVNNIFDTGAKQAQKHFEDYVEKRMEAYKDKRYSGPLGLARWFKDIFGLPDEVNVFYEEGRSLYIKEMDTVLDRIAETVEVGLNAAKNEISKGKKEVQDYVNSLPASLKSIGEEAAEAIQSKFDELEQTVDQKQEMLIDSLAQKYAEKLQQLDARIKKMKEENRGPLAKAMDSITGVIETINKLKNMLLNVLSRAKQAIGLIIADPIGFLGNLVRGVKQGFQNFIGKIDKYLLEGLMGWLFGTLAKAGIQMPRSFDVKGIFSLVLQILGLGYPTIRSKTVKVAGERNVRTMENTAGVMRTLRTGGPTAIWEETKGRLGDIKSMVLNPIKSFIATSVVIAGITWIISLLNPASAFVKAVKAIIDIILFFIERGSQIMALVNAVIDSVLAIAMGNIAAAASKVELALARSIPVVISFLAALIGLGGISQKVQSIIKKVQKPIDRAIDWVISKISAAIKKLLAKEKDKKGKDEKRKDKKGDLGADAKKDRKKPLDQRKAKKTGVSARTRRERKRPLDRRKDRRADDKKRREDERKGVKPDLNAAKAIVRAELKAKLPKGARQAVDVDKVLDGVARRVKPTLSNLHAEEVMPGKPKNEGVIGFKAKGKEQRGRSVLIDSVRYSQEGTALSHEERWKKAVAGVKRAINKLRLRGISEETIRSQFSSWESEFGFKPKSLTLEIKENGWVLEGEMSPEKTVTSGDDKLDPTKRFQREFAKMQKDANEYSLKKVEAEPDRIKTASNWNKVRDWLINLQLFQQPLSKKSKFGSRMCEYALLAAELAVEEVIRKEKISPTQEYNKAPRKIVSYSQQKINTGIKNFETAKIILQEHAFDKRIHPVKTLKNVYIISGAVKKVLYGHKKQPLSEDQKNKIISILGKLGQMKDERVKNKEGLTTPLSNALQKEEAEPNNLKSLFFHAEKVIDYYNDSSYIILIEQEYKDIHGSSRYDIILKDPTSQIETIVELKEWSEFNEYDTYARLRLNELGEQLMKYRKQHPDKLIKVYFKGSGKTVPKDIQKMIVRMPPSIIFYYIQSEE